MDVMSKLLLRSQALGQVTSVPYCYEGTNIMSLSSRGIPYDEHFEYQIILGREATFSTNCYLFAILILIRMPQTFLRRKC